ncbi:HlyD family secretion protein [Methylovirgula sp. 4M-Z18]|uniref:HlyD family secretion protein n=1 Tax=Methylovirgula sp. 4M-Z18 TaxID=2293567 RepID=UPI000E2E9D72|nr:HlyD family secretion protein [Methylovirgula sp. 4M-Z18]RFB76578.1 HlyD family secretion protein [Methylovirgula sp. 4M-Z18]
MNKAVSEAEVQAGAVPLPAKKRSRKPLLVLTVAAVVAGGIWYGDQWWQVGRWQETTDDAYVGGDATALSPHVAGHIAEVLVEDNQAVSKGQLLVRIDARLFQAALDRAQANVKEQQATLDNLNARLTLQLSSIKQAEADLVAKKAEAVFTAQDAKRYLALASSNAGSEQNAQKAAVADQQAQAAIDASEAGLAAANQQLKVLGTQIEEAQANLAVAQADLETARLNLGYTEVRAPIDGYIGNRAARVGAYVADGGYLLTIIPSSGLWIDANFKEDQLERMKPGQSTMVVADVAPGHTLQGHVVSVAPATGAVFSVIPPENATGNFTKIVQRVPVRIVIDGASAAGTLRPGLSTTVTVDVRPQ